LKFSIHILLITISITLNAQTSKKIEILNADKTIANTIKHPDYWRLIGNVSFKHNNAIMKCDSAYHYANKDKMKAFGKVKIFQGDSTTLTGKKLIYFGKKNIAEINGNVILNDKHMTLETQKILYNLKSNLALYPNAGKIIDDEKTINSKKGSYFSNTHKFIFTDSVTVTAKDYIIFTDNMHYNSKSELTYFFGPSNIISDNKSIYCENGWYNTKTDIAQFKKNATVTTDHYILTGDSLFYDKNKGYAVAINNVKVIDTLDNTTIYGGFAEYFEKENFVEVTQTPMLQILFTDDTMFMHANKFISQQKIENKKILAYNKVKFFKSDFQGKCDSLSYHFTDSIIEMYKYPILWSNEYQITADSLKFLVNSGKVEKLFLKPNPMIIAQEDSLDFNQIKGKNIIAYFSENKMKRMNVKGNGQSIFIVKDEETEEKIGLNYTECTDLILYFKDNKLNTINYEIKPNSITKPYKDIKEKDRYLKGFYWRGNEQPKSKEDIFTQ